MWVRVAAVSKDSPLTDKLWYPKQDMVSKVLRGRTREEHPKIIDGETRQG